jgi:hypothetical protein
MEPRTAGTRTLELRYGPAHLTERLPPALIQEVVKALPDDSEIRRRLIDWTHRPAGTVIARQELIDLEQGLAEYAHGYTGELGEVGHLPHTAGGQIVDARGFDDLARSIPVTVVLALALRRLNLLYGLGAEVLVVETNALESTR